MYDKSTFWKHLKSGKFASMVSESSKGEYLTSSSDVFKVMKPVFAGHDDMEVFYCIFLNAKHRVMAIEKMFAGTIDRSEVYPREIIKRVLALKALTVILIHNHPSGSTDPSVEDKVATIRVMFALMCIDVTLLDHIIIGDKYYSMADDRVLFDIRKKINNLIMSIYDPAKSEV